MNNVPQRRERNRLSVGWLAVVLAMLPTLYALSIGPSARLVGNDPARIRAWTYAYAPLIAVALRWPPAENAVNWYVDKYGANYFLW